MSSKGVEAPPRPFAQPWRGMLNPYIPPDIIPGLQGLLFALYPGGYAPFFIPPSCCAISLTETPVRKELLQGRIKNRITDSRSRPGGVRWIQFHLPPDFPVPLLCHPRLCDRKTQNCPHYRSETPKVLYMCDVCNPNIRLNSNA